LRLVFLFLIVALAIAPQQASRKQRMKTDSLPSSTNPIQRNGMATSMPGHWTTGTGRRRTHRAA
jgi:hypothetical protein